MGLNRTTDPVTYPVTLTEVKNQVRVTGTDHDDTLNALIAAATTAVENYTGLSLIDQTWTLTLDGFSDAIKLPRGPVQSITTFNYVDADGVTQALSSSLYTLDTTSDPQWIVRNSSASWPTVQDAVNVVTIAYLAGFASVPTDIKHAILLTVAAWFDDREGGELPKGVISLLSNYRTGWFAA